MNKRIFVLAFFVVALLLSAVSPWPAKLTIINYTGDNIYIRLSVAGVQKYFLTATPLGNTTTRYVSVFEVERLTGDVRELGLRRVYVAEVTACGVTRSGTMDIRKNLRLTFTDCRQMVDWTRPQYWGEPRMEKVNFYVFNERTGTKYPLPLGLADDVLYVHWWDHLEWRFDYEN